MLSDSKSELRDFLEKVKEYLNINLKLTVKGDHRIFPVSLGIDFVGYVHFHTHKLLRPSIKKAFARLMARRRKANYDKKYIASVASYLGWAKHCNSRNLIKKLGV